MKILFLAANPKETTALRLNEEVRDIDEGLQRSKHRDLFQLKQLQACRSRRDIGRAMLEFRPQVVHFSGHGAGEQGLVFENDSGNIQLVSTEALASLFELFDDCVKCAVLNACYSKIQADAISQYIPYVIGMDEEIGDKAAIEFAVGFYDALAAGETISFAYKFACNAIRMAGIKGHLIPKLLEKNGNHSISNQLTAKRHLALSPESSRFFSQLKNFSQNKFSEMDYGLEVKKTLKKIQLASLKLLLVDQLNNGGWGKTFLFRQQGQALPPRLCTFGGTSLAFEAITICTQSNIPNLEAFKNRLEPLLSDNGIYYQSERKGNVGSELQPENIRHVAGASLIRSSFLNINAKDKQTARFILEEISTLIEDYSKPYKSLDLEHLDLSMALKALLNILYASEKKIFLSHNEALDIESACFKLFNRIVHNSQEDLKRNRDIRLLWGFKNVSPENFGLPLLQWWSIWSLFPFIKHQLDFSPSNQNYDSSSVELMLSWIELFLENTVELTNSTTLLPSSYSPGLPPIPTGESSYSTAMAIVVCNYLEHVGVCSSSKEKLQGIRNKLVAKFLDKGLSVATKYPLQPYSETVDDIEGYFAWIAILIACKTLGLTITENEFDWANRSALLSSTGELDLDTDFTEEVEKAAQTIEAMWNNSDFILDNKGYLCLKKR